MTLVTQFLVVLAFPVITVGLILLLFDRFFGTNFYNPAGGGNPLLWQHLFWLFGHPEVYILILPAMGIVSEVLPTFARKPLFGYPFVVFSGIAIAFMSWGVGAHHMFTTGLGAIPTISSRTPTTSSPTSTRCCSGAPSSGCSPASTTGIRSSPAGCSTKGWARSSSG